VSHEEPLSGLSGRPCGDLPRAKEKAMHVESANTAWRRQIEFPDAAGYPDGVGTLDEGTGAFGAPDTQPDEALAIVDAAEE